MFLETSTGIVSNMSYIRCRTLTCKRFERIIDTMIVNIDIVLQFKSAASHQNLKKVAQLRTS